MATHPKTAKAHNAPNGKAAGRKTPQELLVEAKRRIAAEKASAKPAKAAVTPPPPVAAPPKAPAVPASEVEPQTAPKTVPPPPAGFGTRTSGSPGNSRGSWCSSTNEPAGKRVEKPGREGDYMECPVCHKILKVNVVKTKATPTGERRIPYHFPPQKKGA